MQVDFVVDAQPPEPSLHPGDGSARRVIGGVIMHISHLLRDDCLCVYVHKTI